MSTAFQNMKKIAGVLMIFLFLAAFVAAFYFHFYGDIKPLHYDDPPYLSTRSNMGNIVIVAREANDIDKPMAAFAAGKHAEYSEMIQSERFYLIRNGTGITVLERGSDISKVKIRRDGREGYVYNREIVTE